MKLATEPYEEPQKDRSISRMILLSAVLHVVIIGALVFSGYFRSPKPPTPQLSSYEVTLVGPTGTGKRKAPGEKDATSSRQENGEKPTAPAAKGEPQEALSSKPPEKLKPEGPVKPAVKEAPIEKPREATKPVEPSKPKPTPVVKEKEPPIEKPREATKPVEPSKPKLTPVVKEKEPPKPVAVVKPEKKTPPPPEKKPEEVKVKEPAKPPVTARLSEKKEKPKPELPSQPERAKAPEKKLEARKADEKPKTQSAPPKAEQKPQEPVKVTTKEKASEPKKAESANTPAKKQTAAVPVATKATLSKEEVEVQDRQDEEARNNLIASAVDRVRSREEMVARERDIAKAVDRVRHGVGGQEESNKGTEKHAAVSTARTEKNDGDGLPAKAKVYGSEFLAYTEDIKQRVKEGWIVADRRPGLKAIVRFGVEADGAVVDVELAEPSGDRAFDQSALRAVRNAKLPSPPEMYREEFAIQKVHMTFGGEE